MGGAAGAGGAGHEGGGGRLHLRCAAAGGCRVRGKGSGRYWDFEGNIVKFASCDSACLADWQSYWHGQRGGALASVTSRCQVVEEYFMTDLSVHHLLAEHGG